MKVLVVGGNRFVGLELVNRLLLEGHEVTILALDAPPDGVARHAKWVKANRNEEGALETALAGQSFEAVVDNIAYEGAHVEKLARALQGRLGHYVLTSTVDIYGLNYPRGWAEDEAPLEPSDVEGAAGHERYQRGKRGAEKAVRALGLPWTVLRPSIVTGRYDNIAPPPTLSLGPFEESSRSLFFAPRVLDGGPILLRREDEGLFKLTWVQDVARAAALALTEPRMRGEAYNVASEELWTTERYVRALCQVAGREADLVWVTGAMLADAHLADYEPGYGRGPFWSVAPSHKLLALGWRPTPPEIWMAKLLECAPAAHQRASYERRLSEIALARHVRRRQGEATLLPAKPLSDHAPMMTRVDAPALEVPLPAPPAPLAAMTGSFTQAGSEAWLGQLAPARLHPAHFRPFGAARVSSVGIGTWMGDTSAATDALYVEAIRRAVKGGINVVDTAINYRHMKAERAVGAALRSLQAEGVSRESVLVSTKGGFVTHDAADPRSPERYVRDEYVDQALLGADDAARQHCIGPKFIRAQVRRSLANLGLAHVDVYYLHNPERAREHLGNKAFFDTLRRTFEVLEGEVGEGRLGVYGLATWNGLVCAPGEAQHVAIEEVVEAARDAGGAGHHFKVVQLPFNIGRTDAYASRNQQLDGRRVSMLKAAEELGLQVFTSASVLQGQPTTPEVDAKLARLADGRSRAMAALQFARSAPGVGTALVGMRRVPHVDDALGLALAAPLSASEFDNICE